MNKHSKLLSLLLLTAIGLLSGCQVIGDIFKAGVWTGVLLIVAVVALIIFLIGKMSGKK